MYGNIHEIPEVVRRALNYCTLHKVDFTKGDEYDGEAKDRSVVTNIDEANVVSCTYKTMPDLISYVLLDIDQPAALLKSSTKDHNHLYVELPVAVGKKEYAAFLKAAADIGLIQEGYAFASISRGFSSLRLPWIRKATT